MTLIKAYNSIWEISHVYLMISCTLGSIYGRYCAISTLKETANGIQGSVASAISSPSVSISITPSQSQQIDKADCINSWSSYLLESTRKEQSVESSWQVNATPTTIITAIPEFRWYATMQSFGPNTTYTACDGILRLRFEGRPTLTKLSTFLESFTVSISSTYTPGFGAMIMSKYGSYDKVSEVLNLPKTPTCRLDANTCANLQGHILGSFGVAKDIPLKEYRILEEACPTFRACNVNLGQEVVLLYWPPKFKSRNICGENEFFIDEDHDSPRVFTTSAIEFKGKDLWSLAGAEFNVSLDSNVVSSWKRTVSFGRTTLFGNWSFTYPTVYLAHQPMTIEHRFENGYASSSQFHWESSQRTLRTAGVLPLRAEDVFSVIPIISDNNLKDIDWPNLVAKGEYRTLFSTNYENLPYFETLPFEYANLPNPVPASVYFRMRSDCWGHQSHCGTITDDSYRPTLSLRDTVWSSILKDEMPCELPVIVDPPLNLRPIEDPDNPGRPQVTLKPPKNGPMSFATPNPTVASQQQKEQSTPQARSAVGSSTPTPTIGAGGVGTVTGTSHPQSAEVFIGATNRLFSNTFLLVFALVIAEWDIKWV